MSRRRLWLVQIGVGMGVLLNTADSGSINVALYGLAQSFGVSTATASWLVLIGFLTVTSTLLIFGRLSDIFGNKTIFTAGFLVFGAGSALATLAPSFPMLLACRCIQTLGVSMVSANSSAILTECFPPSQRGTALGINSTLVGAGYFVGPMIGGLVSGTVGPRYVFLANLPVALIGFTVATIILPPSRPSTASRNMDFPGAVLFASSAACLLLGLNQVKDSGWGSAEVIGYLAVFVVALAAFLYREKHTREPMMDLSIFSIRLFSLSLLSAFFMFMGTSMSELVVPLYIQQVMMLTPQVAGAAASSVPFVRMLLSSGSGWLADRVGEGRLAAIGACVIATGVFGLSRMGMGTGMETMVALLVVIGIGQGIFFSPNMSATMGSVPRHRLGMASSALGARRNLGQSVGVAIGATLLPPLTGMGAAEMGGSFQTAWVVAALAMAISAGVAAFSGSTRAMKEQARKPEPASEGDASS